MSDTLVTVAAFTWRYDADLWKIRLESEGIAAFIPEGNVSRSSGPVTDLSRFRLQVRAEDAERARGILGEQALGAE